MSNVTNKITYNKKYQLNPLAKMKKILKSLIIIVRNFNGKWIIAEDIVLVANRVSGHAFQN